MSFRLFARTLERPLGQKYTNQTYSTIFSVSTRRPIDLKAFENLKTTLLYTLRRSTAKDYGFGDRADGYVSVKRLLSHPEYQSLDIGQLQDIVSTDRKHRFEFEFDPTKGSDSYWIRAKQWNEIHWVMKPVVFRDQPGTPVYATTLEQWKSHIARNGIPRGDRDWIEIPRSIPSQEYLLDIENNQQVFIFFNLSKCLDAGIRFFTPVPSGQNWSNLSPLVTKGNEAGYIPPSLFSAVNFVTVKKKLLWGDSKPIDHRGWVGYDEWDFDDDGNRQTYLRVVKGITGFVLPETPGLRLGDIPGLKEEAMAMLRC